MAPPSSAEDGRDFLPTPTLRSLEAQDLRLLRLSVLLVLGRWSDLTALRRTAPAGEPNRAWREVLLQTHLFAGFPRLVEAYGVLAEAGGLGVVEADEVLAEPDQPERGRALFTRIYASSTDELIQRLEAYHPDFCQWILGHAYGRVLMRPGLDAARRELCACAALLALQQERQLLSHARGALRCGASLEALGAALEHAAELLGSSAQQSARRTLERLR